MGYSTGLPAPAIMWFRRDLRLADNPALLAAAENGPLVAVFILDPALVRPAGGPRLAYLYQALRDLDRQLHELGGTLTVRAGQPEVEIAALANDVGAETVHIAADYGPYGSARDARAERALRAVGALLVRTGSPYAVAPGRVLSGAGEPYRVFTPFYRAWRRHGWRAPAPGLTHVPAWAAWEGDPIPDSINALSPATQLRGESEDQPLDAGESAAWHRWAQFRDRGLAGYAQSRNRPASDGTSRLSAHLKFGTIHPRTVLAGLGANEEAFMRQVAWREFYGAVLHFWPGSAREYFQPTMADLPWARGAAADAHFRAWQAGQTGYPLVDAGMRQLTATGWMHNRVRMVTASFLVKDLHLEWRRGARHFMRHLLDGDLANNQHGWQWVAGTGTDAAPYFRVLNPVTQSRRFDPDGTYLRRWIPELRDLSAPAIHTPWTRPGGSPPGYPPPIVDHAEQRQVAIDDYRAFRHEATAASGRRDTHP